MLSRSSWQPPCQAHNRCSVNVWVELNWAVHKSSRAPEPYPGVIFGLVVALDKMSGYLNELLLLYTLGLAIIIF